VSPDARAVVTSVLEHDPDAALRALRGAPPGSELLEIRADRLHADAVERLVRECGRPAIVTIRRAGDGGSYDGSEEERRRTFARALRAGALIDVEHASALRDLASGAQRERVVLSAHGAACRIDELTALWRELARSGAARLKLVPAARSLREIGAVKELLARAAGGPPLACFATGAAGRASRVWALAWGSWATYGSTGLGRETGDGQLGADDLIHVYDAHGIGPEHRVHALLGGDVGRSPSPALHAEGYGAHDIRGVYLPIDAVSIGDVETLAALTGRLDGVGVTMPLKQAAAAVSELSDECARAARSVNTIRIEGGRKLGFNTDGPAVAELVARQVPLAGARVAITGAGGTARAAGAALRAAGATIRFFARNLARARAVAEELGGDAEPWRALADDPWQVLVQATPLGRAGEGFLSSRALRGRAFVLDAVYVEGGTPLVRDARHAGVAVADGGDLLVEQALRQFEILNGVRPAQESFERVARERLGATP